MKKLVTEASDKDSAGPVSSLWLLSSNMGSYLGSLAGAAVFDALGFQAGTGIEAMVIGFMIVILTAYSITQ